MKRTKLRRIGKSEVSKCKRDIQATLRQIVILRDGDCVLSKFPEAGACGGYRQDGGKILQAEHLITRERNITFGDLRNIVCLCLRHHGYWKPQNSRLYWELIEKAIGKKRWAWIKKVEKDRGIYKMGIYEYGKIELVLKSELQSLKG